MNKGRVLVVDDSPIVRKMAEVALQDEGYEVFTAEDGEEGLKITKEILPSVILVDFIMPKLSGYQLCQAIRDEEKLKDIPIILITGKGEDVGKKFLKRFGVIDYFIKPFKSADLVQKVNSIIEMQKTILQAQDETEVVPTLAESPSFDLSDITPPSEPVEIATSIPEPLDVEPPVFDLSDITPPSEPVEIAASIPEPLDVEPPVFDLSDITPPSEPVEIAASIPEPLGVEPSVIEPPDTYMTEKISMPQPIISTAKEEAKMDADIEKTVERVARKFFQDEFRVTLHRSISDILKQTGIIKSTDMILSGDLANFSITDVLHMIAPKGLNVKLSVLSETLNADLYINNSNIVNTSLRKSEDSTKINTVSEDSSEIVKKNVYDTICSIMQLESGSFSIEKIDATDSVLPFTPASINYVDALIEASRNVNEKVFTSLFSDNTKFIKIVPDTAIKNYNLNKSELIISACVNGERSFNEIMDITNIETNTGKRSFYVLLNAGIIKII